MEYSFGTWVKRRRKFLDLTQQELARRVGCSVSAIIKIESNERRPSRQIAELLAGCLEIPPDQYAQFVKMARQDGALEAAGSPAPPAALQDAEGRPVFEKGEPSAPVPPPQAELPLPHNALVGREHELRAISQHLDDPACRLLTLTGPGGVGKTRLALEAARRLREREGAAVYYVPLVGIHAPEHIVPAVGDALGFPFSGQMELKPQLFQFLKEKQILLVLDNLEHLLEGVELIDDLLEHAPGVKVLATSREPLNLRAEWVFDVHGLPIPTGAETEPLEQNNAAALFLQRARQVNINFSPTPADLAAIARICRLVEGLPLGLELAASWTRVTSLEEVAQEIEHSIDFLTTNARDVPPRHRSMRAVFDHSWSLLSEEERQTMRRLSVFRGGFTREAAEQAAGAPLALLSALVNKSMVVRGPDRRYDLHDLTAQYAAGRLQAEAGEQAVARARHSAYTLAMLADCEPVLRSAGQRETFERLKPELDNIRAAWDYAVESGEAGLLRRAAGGLYYFYELNQFFNEAAELFRRAAEAIRRRLAAGDGAGGQPAALVEVQGRRAFFLMRSGHNAEALALYHDNLDRLAGLDETFLTAYNFIFLGITTWAVGDYEQSQHSFSQGLPLARELDHPWLLAMGLCFLGTLEHDLVRLDAAYERFVEAMALCRKMGDPYLTLLVGTMFSRTAQLRGQLEQAQELLHESLRIARESGNRWGIGLGLEQLARIAMEAGECAQAHQMLAESVALHREVGDAWSLSRALNALGLLALSQRDLAAAEQHAVEAIRTADEEQFVPNALDGLATLAGVRARQGQATRAVEMALFVLDHPSSPPEAKERAEALLSELAGQPSGPPVDGLQKEAWEREIGQFL